MEFFSPALVTGPTFPLPATDELLQSVLDVSLTPIQLWRPVCGPDSAVTNFILDYLNPASQRMPARPGSTLLACFPPAEVAGIFAFCHRVFVTGVAGRYDTPCQADEPTTLYQLVARRSGALLIVSFPDTADYTRPAAEEALRDSQIREAAALAKALRQRRRLFSLFKEAPGLVARLSGPDHVIELANDAFRQAFGFRELVGKTYREAAPELTNQRFFDWLDEVYRTGKTYHGNEVPAHLDRTNSGQLEPSYFNFTYQATHDAAGAVAGILVCAYDVTEQVVARQQLQQLNEALETSVRERTQADVLAAPELTQAASQVLPLLDMMQGAVERFQLTLAQLTDIVRLQAAHTQPAETVDLATLIEDVRLDLAPLLAAAKPDIRVDVTGCPSVSFAPRNLRSIVYNLLSNAVKYRDPARPPVVQLRCHSTEGATVLEVQDNGLGLDETQQARLFGLFQRLHSHVEGSGVGLYMIKKIVGNAGGTIRVESQRGVGSSFVVSLPG
ncbi:PAS/PAC sensor signal transduction histidine kinase [Hymenobacter roseosalivarius DSM 11622]|uniref:histidine kinase n=1 Tax=Hymenobacter roseosalivarius DSM 11622 TaxID=645990 RepID=A0A1W1ULP2_9BACT|nr:ATP-binding protein [Hymenobacter roseosalivarius]SMB82026.1 PAS/PAC sensor signal transduction histidine kinase [Hymenobacter roseosalivarius DSM 11622]